MRLITLGPTLLVAVFLRNGDASFDTLTEWLNIVQSLVLPFVVIPVRERGGEDESAGVDPDSRSCFSVRTPAELVPVSCLTRQCRCSQHT